MPKVQGDEVMDQDKAMQEVFEVFDRVVDPDGPYKMTRTEYKNFMDDLISDLQIRLEAAEQEDEED
jgi:hypothetical protein